MVRLKLLKLNFKNFIKLTPIALIGSLIPLLFVGVLLWFTANNLYEDKEQSMANVGIVMVDIKDSWYETALNYMSEMDSTADTVSFVKYDSINSADEALASGEIAAYIYIPENIVDSILYGENMPATITFPKNINIATVAFSEMTKAAAEFLSAAQAGTYTTGDLYLEADIFDRVDDAYTAVDIINFSYVLSRESLYITQSTNLTENLNQMTFYCATALMLLLLYLGVSYNKPLRNDEAAFVSLVKSNKISPFYLRITKFISFTFIVFVLQLVILLTLSLIKNENFNEIINVSINTKAIMGILIVALFISSYNQLIYSLENKPSTSILTLFIFGTIMTILSGGVIPRVFFPNSLNKIGQYLPTSYIHKLFSSILSGTDIKNDSYILLIYSVALMLITYLIVKISERRNK